MFRKLLFTGLFSLCLTAIFAQNEKVKWGIRAGLSTTEIDADELIVTNDAAMEQLRLAVADANYGFHFGFFTQVGRKFFMQPEILFNSNSVDFKVTETNVGAQIPVILRETYQYLDVPLMLGFRAGPIRLQGGPVGHVFLNSSSELTDVAGYEDKFDEFTYGWQAGLGVDFWNIVFDLKYEGNFNNFGDHIVIDGREYEFSQAPTRVVATVGVAF